MAGMGTLATGHDINYYLGLSYYTVAGTEYPEPPGVWAGTAAARLGLTGNVDPQQAEALFRYLTLPDGTRLDTPGGRGFSRAVTAETVEDRIEEKVAARVAALGYRPLPEEVAEIRLREQAKQRNTVMFFDYTQSVSKSVSLLWASYLAAAKAAQDEGNAPEAARCRAQAQAVEGAVMAGARTALHQIERNAFVRTGHHSAHSGMKRDAAGVIAAQFLQHTSREGDPQLHVHTTVLNRAQRADGEDGRWRTLDSKGLFGARLRFAAFATLEIDKELTRAGFGLVAREDGNGTEVGGVDAETMGSFSSRRVQITEKLKPLVDAYVQKHGHEPNQRALWGLRQQANLSTRKSKSAHGGAPAPDAAATLEEWERKAAAAEVQVLRDIHTAVEAFAEGHTAGAPLTGDLHRTIRIAVHQVQVHHAAWTVHQLAWEIARAFPPFGPETDPVELLPQMIEAALTGEVEGVDVIPLSPAPDRVDVSVLGVRASDGRSVTDLGVATYCTAEWLDLEEHLIESAARPVPQLITAEDAQRALAKTSMNRSQRNAVLAMLTMNTAVKVLVGPAGTGKTFVLARFAEVWKALTGGDVIGVTASTNAARVMAGEGMHRTYNAAQFLGKVKGSAKTRGHVPVGPNDVVILDEASQVGSPDWARIDAVVRKCGARMIAAGDPGQLGSAEAGGMMREIVHRHGAEFLEEVRRFKRPWQAKASLRLRSGDLRGLLDYQSWGCVWSGPQDEAYMKTARRWVSDYVGGNDVIMLAGTNAEAAELSRIARQVLIEWRVLEAGRDEVVLADGNDAGVGDLIRARENDQMVTVDGQHLANRDTLRITGWKDAVASLGAVAVVERRRADGTWSDPFQVSAQYLREHGELAYAGNVHVAEGQTIGSSEKIGHAHLLVTDTLTRESLYTGSTRATDLNLWYVVTGPSQKAPGAVLGQGLEMQQAPQVPAMTVLAGILQREDAERTATATIRDAQREATHSGRLFGIWQELIKGVSAPAVDQAVRERVGDAEYQRYLTDPQRPVFQQQMRAAELSGHSVGEVLDRVTGATFEGASSIAAVLHGRVAKLSLAEDRAPRTWEERTPDMGMGRGDGDGNPGPFGEHQREWQVAVREVTAALSHRQLELGLNLAEKPEPWAVRYLGMPPKDAGILRGDWVTRAGVAASYREAAGHEDPEAAVGPFPSRNPELQAAWKASVQALELQEEEQVRVVAQAGLEERVREYGQALAWAPPDVSADLAHTQQAELDTQEQERGAREAGNRKMAASAHWLAGVIAERREDLEIGKAARDDWAAATQPKRDRAREAQGELGRRGLRDPRLQAIVDAERRGDFLDREDWALRQEAEAAREAEAAAAKPGLSDSRLQGIVDAERRGEFLDRNDAGLMNAGTAQVQQAETPGPREMSDPRFQAMLDAERRGEYLTVDEADIIRPGDTRARDTRGEPTPPKVIEDPYLAAARDLAAEPEPEYPQLGASPDGPGGDRSAWLARTVEVHINAEAERASERARDEAQHQEALRSQELRSFQLRAALGLEAETEQENSRDMNLPSGPGA